jgi:predicted metal-dependent phosphoesterase TrpH
VSAPVDLACVVHCHSTCSDGTGTVAEIAAAAARAGADAVLLTDHDSLEALRRGHQRWHSTVLVAVGLEVSPLGRNHYLAFGLTEEIDHAGMTPAEIVRTVAEAGGIGFAAHPFSEGSPRFARARGMPFDVLDAPEMTGVELWSWVTDTAERLGSLREAAAFVARPERVVERPPERNLAAWDALCAQRPVVALGGIDAHQIGVRVGGRVPLRLMGYHRSFRHLRTHVLLDRPVSGDAARDVAAVYAALGAGRCYLAVDSLAPARGFRFAGMGSEVAAPFALSAHVPRPAELRLLCGGRLLLETYGVALDFVAEEPGAYRVEALLPAYGRQRMWIISNPAYVR